MTTPFDGPQSELAWMFLQSVSEGGDLDEGFALLSDDFTFWSLVNRAPLDKQAFRRALERRKHTPEFTIDLLRFVTEGDTVVVEAHAESTTAEGTHYETPFVCIIETRDGQIVSMREYSDTRSAAALLPG